MFFGLCDLCYFEWPMYGLLTPKPRMLFRAIAWSKQLSSCERGFVIASQGQSKTSKGH